MEVIIILYVSDQTKSRLFYHHLLHKEPELDVPGMTEFILGESCRLGLMPSNGIASILGNNIIHPETGNGIPRCELYLRMENIEQEFENSVNIGATVLSPIIDRDWGDKVFYLADPDGHIIAFAAPIRNDVTI